jgi:hypothetical protein
MTLSDELRRLAKLVLEMRELEAQLDRALRSGAQPPHAPDVPAADAAYRKARRENEE